MRSSLAFTAPLHREPDPVHARRAAAAAWHQTGIILINPEWLGEWDRKQAEILAEKLFGERQAK